jgi:hypothetical protein
MKVNRNAVIGIVVVVALGAVTLLVVNAPALWEMILRMHGMR